MSTMKLGLVESKFADIIWENEPMSSGDLFKLAEKELNWKRQTSYTVLKRLCERGIFTQEGKQIAALMSREEFYALQSEQFVEETFQGSLPAFFAAFTKRKALTAEEIAQIREMIDSYEEG